MSHRHDGVGDGNPAQTRPYGAARRPDHDVLRDIEALLADPARTPEAADIEVGVSEGVVTLRGTTRWPRDRAAVRRVVGRIPGVAAVGCDLRAREPEPGGRSRPYARVRT